MPPYKLDSIRHRFIQIPRGLGDAFYCFPLIKYLADQKYIITLITAYPRVFKTLGRRLSEVTDDYKKYRNSEKLEIWEYNSRKNFNTTIFEDLMISANISENLKFKVPWNQGFTDNFLKLPEFHKLAVAISDKKRITIIKEPHKNHMHKFKNRISQDPKPEEMQDFINKTKDKNFFISVGHNEEYMHRLKGIDIDLNDKLSLLDFICLCNTCDLIVTQVSHLVPMAQAFNKKLLIFYPKADISHVTPEKFGRIYSGNLRFKEAIASGNKETS